MKQLGDDSFTKSGVPTVLPFHTFTYSSLSGWMIREISKRNADRVILNITSSGWFPGFMKRPPLQEDLSHDSERALRYPFPYPLPPQPDSLVHIGYVSSDFTNHPLAHLMQSVFGFHDRKRFKVFCYSLSPSDNSPYRKTIENGSDVFVDVSFWKVSDIVGQIVSDGIHVLVNLNGYTKGGKTEIFAARPAPIQVSVMGYASTMGAGNINDNPLNLPSARRASSGYFDSLDSRFIDYAIVDEIVCPRKLVCGHVLDAAFVEKQNSHSKTTTHPQGQSGDITLTDDTNRVYTERLIYMPQSYFVNDHRQGFREPVDSFSDTIIFSEKIVPLPNEEHLSPEELKTWTREQVKRTNFRKSLFPNIREDTVIYANFNQLYKLDPDIFSIWLQILVRVPNSILWLLQFPPAGETNLREQALNLVGEEVCKRLVFTGILILSTLNAILAVAPKEVHIHRGRIADVFLDTPECNAHTTAADILWSGTPIITFPKYEYKMCTRVAASVAYGECRKFANALATGCWDSREALLERPVGLAMPEISRLHDDTLLGHWMVVNSYSEYEEMAVGYGNGQRWTWKQVNPSLETEFENPFAPGSSTQLPVPFRFDSSGRLTHVYIPESRGVLTSLRRNLFLSRDHMPLFDTARWVRNLETGLLQAWNRFSSSWAIQQVRNRANLGLIRAANLREDPESRPRGQRVFEIAEAL